MVDLGQTIFYMGHNFYVGWVGEINFCLGQVGFGVGWLLFTRRDYFTILQLII